MKLNNLSSWEYDKSLEMLLFFAQRMDELLFHHSTDSYRYPVLSLISLCDEFIQVYEDANKGIIARQNIDHIMEEFIYRLKGDSIAINILSKEYIDRFVNHWQEWSNQTKHENILFVRRKLGGNKYYYGVVALLRKNIENNTEKRLVDRYAAILIRLLIDEGYNENYIYKSLHEVFFYRKVKSADSFQVFVDKFSFKNKKYTVYIGFSQDLSRLLPLFKILKNEETDITNIDLNDLPIGIKAKGQKTILRFEKVSGLDLFSAYELVTKISSVIVNSYGYYSHIKSKIKVYGQVIGEDNQIRTINEQELLKYRVSARSHEESQNNADKLIDIIFTSFSNLNDISKITKIHNLAVSSDNTSDSLLSLWSVLETLSEGNEEDKIQRIKKCVVPFLVSTYVEKIISTCMMDIKRWDLAFFNSNIASINPEMTELEATFAFLVLDEMDPYRKQLYSQTDNFPLLRYRVYYLNAQMRNTKGYAAMIKAHKQRVEWQLHRIYRERNYIIHDGQRNEELERDLVINLHSYVDLTFNKVIDLMNKSPYINDEIKDVIIEQRLKTIIMEEKLKGKQKERITKESLKSFLYYDFEL